MLVVRMILIYFDEARNKKTRTLKLIDYIFILLILKMNPSRLWSVCLNWGAMKTDAVRLISPRQIGNENIKLRDRIFLISNNIETNQQRNSVFNENCGWRLNIRWISFFLFAFCLIFQYTYVAGNIALLTPFPWNSAKINIFHNPHK